MKILLVFLVSYISCNNVVTNLPEQVALDYVRTVCIPEETTLDKKKIFFKGHTNGESSSFLLLGEFLGYYDEVEATASNSKQFAKFLFLRDSLIEIKGVKHNLQIKRPIRKYTDKFKEGDFMTVLEVCNAIDYNDKKYVEVTFRHSVYSSLHYMIELSKSGDKALRYWKTSFEE